MKVVDFWAALYFGSKNYQFLICFLPFLLISLCLILSGCLLLAVIDGHGFFSVIVIMYMSHHVTEGCVTKTHGTVKNPGWGRWCSDFPENDPGKGIPNRKSNKRNHREQGWNILKRKFLESLAASPEYVNTKRILGPWDWKQCTCA